MYSDKAAEFQDDRLFDLVAMGVQNVWICEVGSKATDATFEEFQERLISSKVKVSYSYDDSFIECMVDNQCLDSVSSFVGCLIGVCSPFRLQTETSNCVKSKADGIFANMFECFDNKRSDVQVQYTRGDGDSITFGWNADLKLNNEVVQTGDNFQRYESAFANVPWGSKTFNISWNEQYVFMDYENLQIIQT